jgi:hypothetical protein
MSPWHRSPGRPKSPIERLLGLDWKGITLTLLILLSLIGSLIMQRRSAEPEKRSYVPASKKIQEHNSRANQSGPRTINEVAPRFGGLNFMEIKEEIEEGPIEHPAKQTATAPDVSMPQTPERSTHTVVEMAEDRMRIKKPAGGQGEKTFRGGGNTSSARAKAEDKPKQDKQDYRVVEGYRKNTTHGHGKHKNHRHGAQGKAQSGKGHRHKVRYKVPVERGQIPSEVMEKLGLHRINVYRLEEIAREMHDESLRTGQEMTISGEQARDIANEIGLTTGDQLQDPTINPGR